MQKLFLITIALVAGAAPAHAGPVAAAVAWVGSAIAAGGVLGAVVQMAVSMGLSFIAQKLIGKPKEPGTKVEFDTQMGDNLPLRFTVGEYATAGQRKYINSWGKNTRFITEVIEVSTLPQGIADMWVDGERADWDGTRRAYVQPSDSPFQKEGFAEGASVPGGAIDVGRVLKNKSDDGNRIWLKILDGSQTAADPFLLWAFGGALPPAPGDPLLDVIWTASNTPDGLDGKFPWSADMVGRGKTYAIVTTRYDSETLTSYPAYLFEPNPLPCYDLRKDSTNGGSGTQRWNNPATWTATRNPAIIAYNIIRGVYFGTEWVYGGRNLPAWRLPSAEWIAAANACDAPVALDGGGTEPRYRSGAEVTVNTDAADLLEEIGRAANMRLIEVGGRIKPLVDLPAAAALGITDGDIIITEGQSFQPFYPVAETFNAISATYPERGEKWATKDSPEYIDTDALASDGDRYLPTSISYPAAPFRFQVQRLQRAQLLDYRRMRRHQFSLPPDAYRLEPGDLISWNSDRNGYSNKLLLVETIAKHPGMNVSVSLREVDPGDYDWSSAWQKPVVIVPPNDPPPKSQVVPGLLVEPAVIVDEDGVSRRPAIKVSCAPDQSGVTRIELQARVVSKAINIDTSRPYQPPHVWYLRDVLPNTNYEVRGRLVSDLTPVSTWSSWMPVTTPDVRIGMDDLADQINLELAKIDAAELEAQQASAAAQNALSAAQNASAHADTIVQQTRADLAVDFQTAINAAGQADTAMLAAQAARDLALGAASDADDAKNLALGAVTNAQAARDAALGHSQAASTAKQAAQDAKTAAEQAKALAEAQALAASNSAGAAAGSASTATSKATEAGQSATAAAAQVVIAKTGAARVLPAEITDDYWRDNLGGVPGNSGLNGQVIKHVGYVTVPASDTNNIHFLSQAALPWIAGRIYRITVTARAAQAGGWIKPLVKGILPDFTSHSWQDVAGSLPLAGTGDWETVSIEKTLPALPDPTITQFRIGVFTAESLLPDIDIDLRSILVEDVTSEKSAAGSATAAVQAQQAASASETAAGQQAAAAASSATTASTKAGQASTSASQAAQSETNAAGSASAASQSATTAAKSATTAGQKATAAAGSASTASTKATEASQSAQAAASSATIATTKAGEASTSASQAASSKTDAAGSASSASNSATAAADSATQAGDSASAASGFASTAETKATEASQSATAAASSATTASTKAGEASTSAQQAAQSKTDAAGSASSASNSATAAAGSATLAGQKATAASGSASTASTKATEAEQSATAAAASATTASTKAGEASTSASQASASKTDAAGSASAAASSATTAANSATTAGQKATAASTSASQAGTHATNAGSSAAAANTAKLAAESARDGSVTARGQAEIARNDAVTAKNDANTAAAGAMSSMNMAAQIAGTGNGLIDDQFLGGSSWTRYQSGGVLSRLPNEVYPIGNTWVFNVQASQTDGMYIRSTDPAWIGDPNPNGLVVEIEYDFPTGNTDGSGVHVEFRAGGTNYNVAKRLKDMDKSPYAYGRRVASGVFIRPSNYSGSFERITVYLMANWSGMHPDPKVKTLRIHRVNVRVATEEEMGRGEVMAAVTAKLSNEYMTAVQTTQAVANAKQSVEAQLGTTNATVSKNSTALSSIDGSVARFSLVTNVNGGKQAAGLEVVSFDGNGNGSGSAIVLNAMNIIAKGTLSTDALVVGLGKNLLIDPEWMDGLANWSGSLQFYAPGTTNYANPAYPVAYMFSGAPGGGTRYGFATPAKDEAGTKALGYPVAPGETLIGSIYANAYRCSGQFYINYYDAAGVLISTSFGESTTQSFSSAVPQDGWRRIKVKSTVPAGAVLARFSILKTDTNSGQADSYLFLWKPQLEKTNPHASEPSEWSPGGVTFINGGRLFAESILTKHLGAGAVTADKISVNDLSAISANLGTIQVGTGNIGNLAVNRLKIAGNAVTVPYRMWVSTTGTGAQFSFNTPDQSSIICGFSGSANIPKGTYASFWLTLDGDPIMVGNYHSQIPADMTNGTMLTTLAKYPLAMISIPVGIAAGNHTLRLAYQDTGFGSRTTSGLIEGAFFALVAFK